MATFKLLSAEPLTLLPDNTPEPVATRLMCNPTVRMTARLRRHYERSRLQLVLSHRPVIAKGEGNAKQYNYHPSPPAPYDAARRLGALTFRQLANLAKRLPGRYKQVTAIKIKSSLQALRERAGQEQLNIRRIAAALTVELSRRGHKWELS